MNYGSQYFTCYSVVAGQFSRTMSAQPQTDKNRTKVIPCLSPTSRTSPSTQCSGVLGCEWWKGWDQTEDLHGAAVHCPRMRSSSRSPAGQALGGGQNPHQNSILPIFSCLPYPAQKLDEKACVTAHAIPPLKASTSLLLIPCISELTLINEMQMKRKLCLDTD